MWAFMPASANWTGSIHQRPPRQRHCRRGAGGAGGVGGGGEVQVGERYVQLSHERRIGEKALADPVVHLHGHVQVHAVEASQPIGRRKCRPDGLHFGDRGGNRDHWRVRGRQSDRHGRHYTITTRAPPRRHRPAWQTTYAADFGQFSAIRIPADLVDRLVAKGTGHTPRRTRCSASDCMPGMTSGSADEGTAASSFAAGHPPP